MNVFAADTSEERRRVSRTGKKLKDAQTQVAGKVYSLEEGIPVVQRVRYAKFDETIELALRLGVNSRHADQMVRGPSSCHTVLADRNVCWLSLVVRSRKKLRELVLTWWVARKCEKIQSGWMDFDSLLRHLT